MYISIAINVLDVRKFNHKEVKESKFTAVYIYVYICSTRKKNTISFYSVVILVYKAESKRIDLVQKGVLKYNVMLSEIRRN